MSKIAFKGHYERTMKQFEAIQTLDNQVHYEVTDYPETTITNDQMIYALTCKRLFPVGVSFICSDDGTYKKGHTYQIKLLAGQKTWEDISVGILPDNITINENEDNKFQAIGIKTSDKILTGDLIEKSCTIVKNSTKIDYNGRIELKMETYDGLEEILENTDYDLTDYPQGYMTNSQMQVALSFTKLFNPGCIYICSDNGTYKVGHIYKMISSGNGKAWTDVTPGIDSSGGIITGNLEIQGNLIVKGTNTSIETETLKVKDNLIVTNSDKKTLLNLSGIAINKNPVYTYGLMYDPSDDTVKFGQGTVSNTGEFLFSNNEGHPIAIRAVSDDLVTDHLIKWQASTYSFVDSGKKLTDLAQLDEENTFNAKNNFNAEVILNGIVTVNEVITATKSIKLLNDITDTVTEYNANTIKISKNNDVEIYTLTFPNKTGTFATLDDVPNLKYTTFKNVDNGNLKEDTIVVTDADAILSIYHQNDVTQAGVTISKNYVEMSAVDTSGQLASNGKMSIAGDTITLSTQDSSNNSKKLILTPTDIIFSDRPKVTTNGETTSEVVLKSDLDNYVHQQSETSTEQKQYAFITNENGVISFRIFENGNEDLQNLIISKTGITVNGKSLLTSIQPLYKHQIIIPYSFTNVTNPSGEPTTVNGSVVYYYLSNNIDTISNIAVIDDMFTLSGQIAKNSSNVVLLYNITITKVNSAIVVEGVDASTMNIKTGTIGTITDTVTQLI